MSPWTWLAGFLEADKPQSSRRLAALIFTVDAVVLSHQLVQRVETEHTANFGILAGTLVVNVIGAAVSLHLATRTPPGGTP